MLWRAGYQATVFEDVEVPVLVGTYFEDGTPWSLTEGELLLFGFDHRAYAEIALWKRMVYPHEPAIGFFAPERLEHVLPPSWLPGLAVLAPEPAWAEFIPADAHDRAFAMIVNGPIARQLHVGPPTEESLQRLLELL